MNQPTTMNEQTKYWKRFFEHSPDILAVIDFEGKIVDVNPAGEKVFGYPKKDVLGKSFFAFIDRDDKISSMADLNKMSEGQNFSYKTTTAYTKDGQPVYLEVISIPNPEDKLIYTFSRVIEKADL